MTQLSSQSPAPSDIEYFRLIRPQIEHEDNLNSQRLSWFVASQSFLFTAYAIVVSNLQPHRLPWVEQQQHLLVILIPIVALGASGLIYLTILAGAVAMRNLRRFYSIHRPGPTSGLLPPVQGYRLTQLFGQAGPLLLPPVFIVVWLILLFHGLRGT
ncbi:MAG TPA: hypothetical protein VG326_06530 [Tepidisphaeraceae bacterium]|jgi:hypothetical protein|nr:hypothetical protein [Tepidisphaeraceae bacterium]